MTLSTNPPTLSGTTFACDAMIDTDYSAGHSTGLIGIDEHMTGGALRTSLGEGGASMNMGMDPHLESTSVLIQSAQ